MNPAEFRTGLIVPLANSRFVAKAHERGVDMILLDLKDGVAAEPLLRNLERQTSRPDDTVRLLVLSDIAAATHAPSASLALQKEPGHKTAHANGSVPGEAEQPAGREMKEESILASRPPNLGIEERKKNRLPLHKHFL
ncbi:MAG: hypothetical protein M0R28_06755 [Pigmentiphaga sp.]|nr:hypothetical protein [Pigmentiphaga sp.]